MLLKHLIWILLLALSYSVWLQAQSYIVDIRKISVEDGLSSRFVNTIYKDSRGFMWIATQYGLSRYDGYVFKPYTIGNNSLTSNIVIIHEDKKQRLWLISSNNPLGTLDILDLQTDRIQSFDQVFAGIAPFMATDVSHVYSDVEKDIWISTKKGDIYRYNNERFDLVFSTPEQREIEIFYAGDQFLWLYGKDLLKVDLKNDTIKKINFQKGLRSAGVDDNNNLWLLHPEQKKMFQASNEKETLQTIDLQLLKMPEAIYDRIDFDYTRNLRLNPADNLIWWFQEDKSDHFFVFHPREGIVFDLQREMKPYLTYERSRITNVYFDSENRTWVATHDGIFIITLKKNKFRSLLSDVSENYSTRGITEDDQGTLYINTYSGRIMLHPEKGKTKKDENNSIWLETAKNSQDSLRFGEKENSVWLGAARDKQGNLWFSGQEEMIEKYDPLSKYSQYYAYPSGLIHHLPWSQWAIIRDKTGRVWTGTHRGLYYLEPETEIYQRFKQYNAFPQLEESIVYHLYEDEKGIWIASSSGLYLLEPGKGITTRYASDKKVPYHIPYDHLLHFYRDKAGIFWLSTKGGGLIRFNPEDGSYQQFTTAEGLSSNTIYAVYEDDYNKLWLPGNYGLMQFDKTSYRVNTYLTGDGIVHEEFNTISHYQDARGLLYFGGLAGVTVFDPEDFVTNDAVSVPLRMTRCRVLNGKTGALMERTAAILNSGKLVLSPSDRSFIIEFALLNYENSRQNSYAYKIEGLDKAWTTIQENSLRINALPYGNYILHVKGQGIKGAWSANELAVNILVKKPFYRENWFILCCIFVLCLMIYSIFRWRLKNLEQAKIRLQSMVRQRTREISLQKEKIEQQAEKLKELNATQSRWFTNIAHELRTPLTLILGPIRQFLKLHSGKTKTGVENIQLAEKNSMGLLQLVNEILDVSRLESDQLKINKRPTALTELIRGSAAHFDGFAGQKKVRLTTHVPYDITLNIDKDRIQKILINLISNALKFTHKGGTVTLSLHYKEAEDVKISVSDTGDGIAEKDLPHIFERYYQASHPEQMNQGGTGIGLALSLELARLHGGDLSAKSQVGKGSVFTLSLPHTLVTGIKKPMSAKTIITHPVLSDTKGMSTAKRSIKEQDKAHILLVEDNPDMRQYIRGFMIADYKITEAADGLEALGFLKKVTPDLIISDIMMPRMDGITLAKDLKDDERLKNIPFITLTARADESVKVAALRIGIDDYLTKPFNPEELEARASNLIRNYKERQSISQTDQDEITAPAYHDTQIAAMKDLVMEYLGDNSFTTSTLAAAQHMSLSSLKRFLKKTTGLSPGQFIREIRLQQARRLLEAKQLPTVLEVVYAVGFENASHFAKLFSERFGKKPSEYL